MPLCNINHFSSMFCNGKMRKTYFFWFVLLLILENRTSTVSPSLMCCFLSNQRKWHQNRHRSSGLTKDMTQDPIFRRPFWIYRPNRKYLSQTKWTVFIVTSSLTKWNLNHISIMFCYGAMRRQTQYYAFDLEITLKWHSWPYFPPLVMENAASTTFCFP